MTLILKTAPANPIFTLDQIKAHLCLTDDNTLSDAMLCDIGAAVENYLDGADGVLGRALIQQSWTLHLNSFPSMIKLPLPPLITVDEIRYRDTSGTTQILSSAEYRVVFAGATNRRAGIYPVDCWPSVEFVPDSIEVDFTCGYGISWNDVPQNTRQLSLMLLASMYENREAEITGTIIAANPATSRAISAAKFSEAV